MLDDESSPSLCVCVAEARGSSRIPRAFVRKRCCFRGSRASCQIDALGRAGKPTFARVCRAIIGASPRVHRAGETALSTVWFDPAGSSSFRDSTTFDARVHGML